MFQVTISMVSEEPMESNTVSSIGSSIVPQLNKSNEREKIDKMLGSLIIGNLNTPHYRQMIREYIFISIPIANDLLHV